MLRVLRRLGRSAGAHPIFSCPDAGSGAGLLIRTSRPAGLRPKPRIPFV